MARRPVSIALVLKSGGEYRREHVEWLRRQIELQVDPGVRLFCLSDHVASEGWVSLKNSLPGWWSKLELCRHDLEGDLLFFDLDTVIVGSLTPLLSVGRTTFLRDVYRGGQALQSSVMYLSAEDRRRVWDLWSVNPAAWMAKHWRDGDQGFFETAIGDTVARWQDVLPGVLVSYKADLGGWGRDRIPAKIPPPNTSVVFFHGRPRPWDVEEPWIPALETAR